MLLLTAVACVPPQPEPQKGNPTLGGVQTRLENGKTTKAQVLEWFGSPNIATIDKNGEIWNYTRQGTATEVSSSHVGAWMLIASGGSSTGFSRSGSYSFDLLKGGKPPQIHCHHPPAHAHPTIKDAESFDPRLA